MADERRQVERVRLREPLSAFIANRRVWIVDIGLLGCRIEHGEPLDEGSMVTLLFRASGDDIAIECSVTYTKVQPILLQTREMSVYQSGLAFERSTPNAMAAVRQIVAKEVTTLLEAQRRNARGESPWPKDVSFFSNAKAERSGDRSVYVQCRLSPKGSWTRTPVYKPLQPADGFTLPASTAIEEIETLCRSYEDADDAGRHLIRACAELSVITDADKIPPEKFRKG